MSDSVLLAKNQNFTVIVPAAGVGKRMLSSCPKQYLTINNQSILSHTISRLLSHRNIAKVVVAISDDDGYFEQTELINNPKIQKASGGTERVDSVLSGLQVIDNEKWVLVHDAARPCVTHDDIDKLIEQCLLEDQGGILSAPVVDTMKCAKENTCNNKVEVKSTIDRSNLWHAFTPQMFKTKELKQAIEKAQINSLTITDEASAIESVGLPCQLISGRRDNIKITRPEDLVLADFYLNQQKTENKKG